MSSGERDSLNLGFPLPPCYASVYCNISAKAGQNLMNFVKMDGVDPPNQTTFNLVLSR